MRTITAQPHHEAMLRAHLKSYFGASSDSMQEMLRSQLSWVEVRGGEVLMRQGEPGDAMFISVSGRLRAHVNDADGKPQPVRDLARGSVIGEMSLYTDQVRSASVVAVRDSILACLSKAAFLQVLAASPEAGIALTRQIVHRLQTQGQRNPVALPVCTALLPASEGVDLLGMAQALAPQMQKAGATRVISVVDADAMLGAPGMAQRAHEDPAIARRISSWLDEVEAENEFILLVGDASVSAWTHCCARQSDEVLLLANAQAQPGIHPVEQDCLMGERDATYAQAVQVLVLIHDGDARFPSNTAAWLARRPVSDHVHVRAQNAGDVARLARLQTRTAVGLVLAGGGARGFAHLGVYRALREHGIEVDVVGGTSMGSLMGTLIASDHPWEQALEVARRGFRSSPTSDFNWLPLVSLIRGRKMRRILEQTLLSLCGRLPDSEDLWKRFYCVATNYSQAREEVLHHGSLRKNLLASVAIPGALPPVVRDGDLLCDGGTLNNFPVDVMQGMRGVGTVIGVDLNTKKPRRLDFDEVPGNWALLRDRLRPRQKRRYRLPTLAAYLMNVTILYSTSRQRQSQRLADLFFNPPLERVGLLQWNRFDQIVEQGYRYAQTVLDADARFAGGTPQTPGALPSGSPASSSPGASGVATV